MKLLVMLMLMVALLGMQVSAGLAVGAVRGAPLLAAEIFTALGGQLRPNKLAAKLADSIAALTSTIAVAAELIRVGNLQEIIWQLQETGMLDKAAQLEKVIADMLATAKIGQMERIGKGVSGAQLVTFANGLRGVYKVSRPAHEVAMYRLDKLIGTNVFPVTVMRTIDGKTGSVQLFIENAPSAAEIKIMRRARGDVHGISNPAAINTLRLLGHDDDHNDHNNIYPIKGRAIAIDGDHAFYHSKGWLGFWKHFRQHLGQSEGEQLRTAQVYSEYRIDPTFISGLEKITPEQIDAVIAPIFALDGDEDLQKIFDKLMMLANIGNVEDDLGSYLYSSLGSSELEELGHLRIASNRLGDRDAYQKLIRITNYTKYSNAVALGGLRNRISQYAAIVRGVDNRAIDTLAPTEIMVALQRQPEEIPRYRHEELLTPLLIMGEWDKEKIRAAFIYQSSLLDAVRKLAGKTAYTKDNTTKPLLWRIVAADNSEHRLLTGSGDSSLHIFSDLSLASIDAELIYASTFIHSGRDLSDNHLAAATALIRSDLDYFFNLLPMKEQLLVWAKAGNKKIIATPYAQVSTRPKMNTVDQLEHEFNLHLAYIDGDLDKLENMAELDFDLDLHARTDALLNQLKQYCVSGERCLIYANIAEVLSRSDDHSNFLVKLSDAGFVVERME